jgi:putative hydrolase of the HAD superfamily
MTLHIRDRVVVFDYGEVISLTPSDAARQVIVEIAGVDAEPFWASYWSHRDGLDRGTIRVPEYWALIAADTGADWAPSTVQRLWAADFTSWISVEPGTVDLIHELHDGGTRLAILSNAGFDFASPLRFSPMARCFERVFVSAEMHDLKPDPSIYLEVTDALGITPAQLVFIDNKKINTDAAAALGATVHHFVGVDGLRSFLTTLAQPR